MGSLLTNSPNSFKYTVRYRLIHKVLHIGLDLTIIMIITLVQ